MIEENYKVKLVNENDGETLFLNLLTGNRDLIVRSQESYIWGTRVMYSQSVSRKIETYKEMVISDSNCFEEIFKQLEKYALPKEMSISKQWTLSVALLPPTLLEL